MRAGLILAVWRAWLVWCQINQTRSVLLMLSWTYVLSYQTAATIPCACSTLELYPSMRTPGRPE
jgi:hypothetical protein